jgi:hypothetical protein
LIAIKPLGANELMIDNPSADHLLHVAGTEDLIGLEDLAEVCLLVNGHSDDKDILTYVLRSGDDAIAAVSNVKHQSGYGLLQDLNSKELELASLLPTIRKCLTEAKVVKMELKAVRDGLKDNVCIGRLQSDYKDGGSSSSDEDDFNGPTQRDPVLANALNDLSF